VIEVAPADKLISIASELDALRKQGVSCEGVHRRIPAKHGLNPDPNAFCHTEDGAGRASRNSPLDQRYHIDEHRARLVGLALRRTADAIDHFSKAYRRPLVVTPWRVPKSLETLSRLAGFESKGLSY
jgi:hypothetical protein